MDKQQVRNLKSHYLSRWALYDHNRKSSDKYLLLLDRFVLSNILSGRTLCYECLGEIYQDILPDLETQATQQKYDNLVLINNLAFKYRSITDLCQYVTDLAHDLLRAKGRVIFSFQHRYLVYDRMNLPVQMISAAVKSHMPRWSLIAHVDLFGKSPPGYGDYWFCFQTS